MLEGYVQLNLTQNYIFIIDINQYYGILHSCKMDHKIGFNESNHNKVLNILSFYSYKLIFFWVILTIFLYSFIDAFYTLYLILFFIPPFTKSKIKLVKLGMESCYQGHSILLFIIYFSSKIYAKCQSIQSHFLNLLDPINLVTIKAVLIFSCICLILIKSSFLEHVHLEVSRSLLNRNEIHGYHRIFLLS